MQWQLLIRKWGLAEPYNATLCAVLLHLTVRSEFGDCIEGRFNETGF